MKDYIKQKMKTCKHYLSPIHQSECAKGINYLNITGGERRGYLRKLPCVTTGLSRDQVLCDSFTPYTENEAIHEYNEFQKIIKQFEAGRDE